MFSKKHDEQQKAALWSFNCCGEVLSSCFVEKGSIASIVAGGLDEPHRSFRYVDLVGDLTQTVAPYSVIGLCEVNKVVEQISLVLKVVHGVSPWSEACL